MVEIAPFGRDIHENKINYVVIFNKAAPAPSTNLNDLPGAGRLDVCCHAISAAFFLSNNFRRDVIFFAVFRKLNKILRIDGETVRGINPDERSIGGVILSVFKGKHFPGITLLDMGLIDFVGSLKDAYVLYEEGQLLTTETLKTIMTGSRTFIIGDSFGFTEEDLGLLSKLNKISIGHKSYLTYCVINIVNYTIDLYSQTT